MRRGKVVLPKNWTQWNKEVLDASNREFTIDHIQQSPDLQTYTALGRSNQFRESDSHPLYMILLDENNNVRFKEFKEEDF